MKQEEFTNLLDKYLNGTASNQEQRTLANYYEVLQGGKLTWNTKEMGSEDEVRDNLLNKINNTIDFEEKKFKNKRMQWFAIAASLFVIVGLGSYFLVIKNTSPIAKQQEQVSIKPGGNKAILTLANGKQIVLNEVKNGEIAHQDDIIITKTEDGKLVYTNVQDAIPNEQVDYNTIKTPRGGQYQVYLPDGTKVWLNAESSLSYPAKFSNKERVVVLKGEGYFEVAKDKTKPFIVNTENQKIEVLGTHFNVNAYEGEPSAKTTLLEGSVKINNKFLKPGQQATVTAQSLTIEEVDVEEAIAWKNGIFLFNNENIKAAMQRLSRWYDVEISYDGNFNDINFGGEFSRFDNLNESIKILESTNKFKCKIVGRRIYIKR